MNTLMNIENTIAFRASLDERDRGERTNLIVYLSELPDGSLEGTQKMTRREYARAQRKMRMMMGEKSEGLLFSESDPAVAYRSKKGMISTVQEWGRWIVWEEAGPRRESVNDMSRSAERPKRKSKKAAVKKDAVKKKVAKAK